MISAKIIADSIGPIGNRLTTMIMTYPRMVHAEHLRHRCFSFSVASSRAIPFSKFCQLVQENPAGPVFWGQNMPGMQAETELSGSALAEAINIWNRASSLMLFEAAELNRVGAHKQIVNRLLEPWFFITVLVSGTDWENFFALRCHKAAQPEIQAAADAALWQYVNHKPEPKGAGEWHLPFGDRMMDTGWDIETKKSVAVARCARVSYQTHDGKIDLDKDLELCRRLRESGHMSPFEHVAQCVYSAGRHANFNGWRQWRSAIPNECRKTDLSALLAQRIAEGSKFAKENL